MRTVLAVAVACLAMGSWHWQPVMPGANAREIYTGTMTLDARASAFTRVAPTTSL